VVQALDGHVDQAVELHAGRARLRLRGAGQGGQQGGQGGSCRHVVS
jgi:hypothetical protein